MTDGAATDDAPAEPPRTGTRQQTSGELQAATEAPVVPAGYSRTLGASLTSSSSLANSSSLSSNPQVQSQDTLSWGEVRSCRDASSSADTQLSQGEVRSGAAREPACLCSSLSEGEVASRHRCSKAPSIHGQVIQAMAEPGRSLATSAVGAAALRREDRGTQKDLSEGEVSEGLFPAGLPYDDTDSTSASDAS